MKILFMGTPDFALFSLRALIEAGEEIVGVITQPDKPKAKKYLSDVGSSFPEVLSFLTNASHPQILRKDKGGTLPDHNSYGVFSTDLDGTRFSVNAAVSSA